MAHVGHAGRESANRQIRVITNAALAVNVAFFIVKVIVGVLSGSLSLVADGLHSVSDLSTDVAVLLGSHFGSREPDTSHPYGHGRIETLSAVLIGVILLTVGGGMVYYAAIDIAKEHVAKPGVWAIIVAAISVVVKEVLYRATQKVAVRTHSTALAANAWHHRSDALSSIAVIIGVVAAQMGYHHGDQVAAIIVGVMIVLVAVRVLLDSFQELTEASVDPDTVEEIKAVVNADAAVRQWHRLRTRSVGREVFLDLHIMVNPDLDVRAAHDISERLEAAIEEKMARPVNITVHIEPDIPEFRRDE